MVPVANMGPTWVLSAPDGPNVGPTNIAIRAEKDWVCIKGILQHVDMIFIVAVKPNITWDTMNYWFLQHACLIDAQQL